jgi:hypothetical protein
MYLYGNSFYSNPKCWAKLPMPLTCIHVLKMKSDINQRREAFSTETTSMDRSSALWHFIVDNSGMMDFPLEVATYLYMYISTANYRNKSSKSNKGIREYKEIRMSNKENISDMSHTRIDRVAIG